MKSLFPSYYQPTPQEFERLWKECVFVFDTNMLFYLYRSSEAARNELLNLLRQLQDRIWLPYQVALEYQRDRLKIIDDLSNEYDRLSKMLDVKRINLIDSGFARHPILEGVLGELQMRIDEAFKNYHLVLEPIKSEIESLKSKHPKWHENDTNRDEIDALFDGKIGKPYLLENLNKIFLDGEARYEKKIPPGYMDAKEKEDNRKYGDLVLWFQTIDYSQEKQKPIIFITDDRKEDWWIGGRDHKENPRPELIQEFFDKTGFQFYAYQPNQFLNLAEKYLQLSTSEATKEEIQAIGDAVALEERDRDIILRSSSNPFSEGLRDTFPYNLKARPFATPHATIEAAQPNWAEIERTRAAIEAAQPNWAEIERTRATIEAAQPNWAEIERTRAAIEAAQPNWAEIERTRAAIEAAQPNWAEIERARAAIEAAQRNFDEWERNRPAMQEAADKMYAQLNNPTYRAMQEAANKVYAQLNSSAYRAMQEKANKAVAHFHKNDSLESKSSTLSNDNDSVPGEKSSGDQ